MWFLYRNIAVFHVFAVMATFAWLFGGIRGEYLVPTVPWMIVLLLEGMICFPQRHDGENSYEARERVWDNIRKDPLTWVSLGFLALLAIPFLNHGLCPVCDYPAIVSGEDPRPTFPVIPFCVNRLQHLNVVLWFAPALIATVAVKHALLKNGKRMLIEMLVWNGVALAIVGAVQQMTGAEGPLWCGSAAQEAYFFSTFGYPNMAGDYFTTMFGLAVGLWRWRMEHFSPEGGTAGVDPAAAGQGSRHHHGEHRHGIPKKARTFWKRHFHLIAVVILFVATVDTLSRASMMLVTSLAIIFYLHSSVSILSKMKRAQRVKAGVASLFVLGLICVCAIFCMPGDVRREIDTIDTTEMLDRMTGKGQYHARVATEIWKDNFLFGVGGWGYKHFCLQYMTDSELRSIQKVGGINVHNDHLQFLAEHGLVGFGALVAIVLLLVWPLGRTWSAMANAIRFAPEKEQPPRPRTLFVLPAPVFCIIATAAATFIHGFGDCPLRSPAVLSLFFVSLAAMDGFLPKVVVEKDRD